MKITDASANSSANVTVSGGACLAFGFSLARANTQNAKVDSSRPISTWPN